MSKVAAPTIIQATSPSSTDDTSKGYHVGWRWINSVSGAEYICADDTLTAAVWNPVGSGESGAPLFVISPVDWFTVNPSSVPTSIAGDFTLGCSFTPFRSVRVSAVRFYWASAGGETVNCKIWDDTTAVVSIAVVTSGIGYYTGTFVTPYEVPSNKVNYRHFATVRDNAGAVYTNTTIASSRASVDFVFVHALPGVRYETGSNNYSVAGDARPTTTHATNRYPVEPIFDYTF